MAKVYQISLHAGAYDGRDKTQEQIQTETGCKPLEGWRDPLLNRPMLSGEVGCAISHLRVWQKIADSGQNGIILEEDAVYENVDVAHVDELLKTHDSVWLGYRENSIGYWYNAHAYAITPETARYLISQGFQDSLVPVDEFLPFALTGGKHGAYKGGSVEKKENYFFDPPIVRQVERKHRPSIIEGTSKMQNERIHLITVATEPEKAEALKATAAKFGWPLTMLGKDSDWRDNMDTAGGFPKIEFVREFIKEVEPDTIVMFMDAYDTFINDTMDTVLERYRGFNADIVIGAEKFLWPDWDYGKEYPESHTPYRYLNSGQYIGTAEAIKKFLEKGNVTEDLDDQAFFHERFLNSDMNVVLDYEAYIFQNSEPTVQKVGEQIFNAKTGCYPCTYHGNGGQYEKDEFERIYRMWNPLNEPSLPLPYHNTLDYEVIGDEVLVTPLFSEAECNLLIEASEEAGDWRSMSGDQFPAQEIRIKNINMWKPVEEMWAEKLGKIAEKHWSPMRHIGLRDAFTMRYTLDTQTSLGLHTDASLVTGSVKLNDAYDGAELYFPRQGFSNKDVPVGHCILFPSSVTHGHEVKPLTGGTKYSLTMWTARYGGDIN
jgi:GR25 family glycosyltransferase involved in LPS biosynthesis